MANATVRVSGDLDADLRSFLRDIDNVVVRAVVSSAEDIAAEAVRQAPVKTGEYKASLSSYVQVRGGRIVAGVRATAPHAKFVRFARDVNTRQGPALPGQTLDLGVVKGSAWTLTVSGPMRLRALQLARELGPQLARAWRR